MALRQVVRIASAMACVLSIAQAGSGQSATAFHGLFGPAQSDQSRPNQLDLNWSLYGAQDIDDTVLLSLDAAVPANQV